MSLHTLLTPVLKDLTPFSGLCGYLHTHTCTPTPKLKIKKEKIKSSSIEVILRKNCCNLQIPELVPLLLGCVLRKCSWIFGILFIMQNKQAKNKTTTATKQMAKYLNSRKSVKRYKGLVLVNNLKVVSPF